MQNKDLEERLLQITHCISDSQGYEYDAVENPDGEDAVNEINKLEEVIELYEDALAEAEAILGCEYADHYGPLFEKAMKARDARNAK